MKLYSLKQCNEFEKDVNKQLVKVQARLRKLLQRESELYQSIEYVSQRRRDLTPTGAVA